MKPLHTLLAFAVSGLLLTACDKKTETPAEPKTETKTETAAPADSTGAATAAKTTVANASSDSPTLKMSILGIKMATFGMIAQEKPSLTDEQKKCLAGDEANATYQAYADDIVGIIGADALKESDKFYDTEVGKKMLTFMDQQLAQAAGLPITGDAVTITDADKAAMQEYAKTNESSKAMEEKITAAMSADPQKTLKQMQHFAAKEKARCNIS